ncbi:MAG: putative lipopolysaccharide heptosyltransferase III [Thermodesulfovibrionales bacterium]
MIHQLKDIKRILVIKLRHIGDVLLATPVFRALRENFPHAYIAALVNSGTEEVLIGNPFINEILIFDRNIKKMNPAIKYFRELSFLKQIRAKKFDMTIDLTSGDRAAIVSFISGARYRIAYPPNRNSLIGKKFLYTHIAQKRNGQHIVLRNLEIIRQFGINTKNEQLDFFIPESARIFVEKIFEENNIPPRPSLNKGEQRGIKIVHVHPTSRWLFKCWKDEYMAEVICWLIDNGAIVIITSSPEKYEMEKTGRILSLVASRITHNAKRFIDLCGKTTIKQLGAISKASDLFFGVDSAPMHIAAAVGTPVIALFGGGVKSWRPWCEKYVVIFKEFIDRKGTNRKDYIKGNLLHIKPFDVIKEINNFLQKDTSIIKANLRSG